jgi:hypothetical protein
VGGELAPLALYTYHTRRLEMSGNWLKMGIILSAAILVAGCSLTGGGILRGSGNLVTRQVDYEGFDRLQAGHGFHIEVSQGEAFSVELRVDDNAVEHLKVEMDGSTLRLGLKSPLYTTLNVTLRATVTMPELAGLVLSGGSDGSITGFRSTRPLALELSGGSELRGDIEAGAVECVVSGGSDAVLTGAGGNLDLEVSGGSNADLSGFAVADATVVASGGSDVTVNASGRLDVKASGGGTVYYLGSPTLGNINTSGGANLRRK